MLAQMQARLGVDDARLPISLAPLWQHGLVHSADSNRSNETPRPDRTGAAQSASGLRRGLVLGRLHLAQLITVVR